MRSYEKGFGAQERGLVRTQIQTLSRLWDTFISRKVTGFLDKCPTKNQRSQIAISDGRWERHNAFVGLLI